MGKRAGRLDVGAEIEPREGDEGYLPRMVLDDKLKPVKAELMKMKKDQCSLTVSLQLTLKALERVRGELKDKHVLTGNLWEATNAKKQDGEG